MNANGTARMRSAALSDASTWQARALDAIDAAVAVVDPHTWAVLHENARFSEWFGAGRPGDALADRVPDIDLDRAAARLGRGRPFECDVSIRQGVRPGDLRVQLRRDRETGHVLVEVRNITSQKQAEYMLDSYSRLVERQTRELEKEKERAEKLLLNIMPRRVYEELKDFGTTSPQTFSDASVLLLDFAGFSEMSIARDPTALVTELNDVFTSFDQIVQHFHCERIKTIGDAYMAVAGVPEPDSEHALHLARVALRMRRFLMRRNQLSTTRWLPRIGIATGPIIGSIVGIQKYVYDIFGPPVNLAARLEARSEPMQILVSAATYEHIRNDFTIRSLGPVELRGFGVQEIFALEDETAAR
jgi:class 3 adenylate cyclase